MQFSQTLKRTYSQAFGEEAEILADSRSSVAKSPSVKANRGRKVNWANIIDRVATGESADSIIDDYPSIWSRRRSLTMNFAGYYNSLKQSCKDPCEGFIPNPWGLQLPLIHHKQKQHYWIYGESETFDFMDKLDEQFVCLRYNTASKFQEPDKISQFVLIDEYNKSSIPFSRLKEMCDGHYQYPVRYLPAVTLKNPIVVVCSNFEPQVLYPVEAALLLARFNVVAIPDDQDEEFKEPNKN